METLLLAIHLGDAAAEEKAKGNIALERYLAAQNMQQVLKNHKITRPAYDSLYNYYIIQPEILHDMYAHILADLSKKQAEVAQ